jgi:signal peptidase I
MLAEMSQDRTSKIAIAVVGAVVLAAMVGMYLINPFNTASDDPRARILGFTIYRAPSQSMEPTIRQDSIFVISAIALRGRDPRVGEVVAYRYPPNPRVHYVSRIIAIGGTTVELRKGELYIDGEHIEQPWLPATPIRTTGFKDRVIPLREADIHPDLPPLAVPGGRFFVLGDNRGNSEDSRVWGFEPRENMIGILVDLEN